MIKLGFIEDDYLLRCNYEEFFGNDDDFSVVFSIDDLNGLQGISFGCQPDFLLLDLELPSGNSLYQLPKIRQYFPYAKIVILSGVIDEEVSRASIRYGADGFLHKSSSMHYIRESLIKSSNGGMPFSPMIITHLIRSTKRHTLCELYPEITKRELELIEQLKTGVANKTAASNLKITYFTVNQHLKSIYGKLKINSKSELIAISNRLG